MGLIHPVDFDAYARDAERRQSFHRLRRLRRSLRGEPGPPLLQVVPLGDRPDVVLVVDSPAFSSRAAVLSLLEHLDPARVALLSPDALDVTPFVTARPAGAAVPLTTPAELAAAVPDLSTVVSAGAHGAAGGVGHEAVTAIGGRSIVVQHGMLLPQVAPLPAGVLLAAWSAADADFWRSGRDDLTAEVVGSELLHLAARADRTDVAVDATPIWCGALHGTELPRREIERIARGFCLATGARYRPHPSETDVQSRLTRLVWRRLGIEFAPADVPLVEVDTPVVGMWSTGILEAATAGLPAWVHHPDPPDWLVEVWHRYGLTRWGDEPTPPSVLGDGEPARRLAELVAAEP